MLARIRNAAKTLARRWCEPLHIEFNLTDFCNLNCKGCSLYSPLAPAEFQGLRDLEEQMKHISQIKGVRKIKYVFLIGGETLLYPDIIPAMGLARKFFPWAEITVFTNGLPIPKMGDDFWRACRANDCSIAITRYPIKFDYDKIEDLCRDKGVKAHIFGDRNMENSFFRLPLDPEKKQNGNLAHFRCFSHGCITVDNGRIFPCSTSACVGHLNRRFGTDYRWEKGDYIEIKNLTDVKQLLRLRNRPVPFCGYCKHIEPVKYGPSRRALEEWT